MKYWSGVVLLCCVVFLYTIPLAKAAYCLGKPHDGTPNTTPVWTQQPTLLKTVKNGKLYQAGNVTTNSTLFVAHVYGTDYEMGYAHGQLLRDTIQQFMRILWAYMEDQIINVLPKDAPEWLKKLIADEGLDVALDLTYEATVKYSSPNIYEEMRGLAEGSGVDYKLLRRVHLIGELTKGACSMFGATGSATEFGKTLQLRAFDWDINGPYHNYPALIVYHPSQSGHAFANLGFAGWIGSFSGMSSKQMAVSEIGVSYPDDTFGKESRIGNPFTFLLRDILQFDNSIDESIERITQKTKRTCNLILGVGDGKKNEFRSFQYSHSVANVISPSTLLPKNDTWHPQIPDVVYHAMDWTCIYWSERMASLLQQYHGKISVQTSIQYIIPLLTSGNLQVVLYDLSDQMMYVSYSQKDGAPGPLKAFDRQFIQFDMQQLFNEPKP